MTCLAETARWRCWVAAIAGCSCGFHHTKYENPITKDTQQPDKVLYDKAIKDLEKGRYEMARLTLNTLINTYDTSEYLAKAKLAIADSWYRRRRRYGIGAGRSGIQGLRTVLSHHAGSGRSAVQDLQACTIAQMGKPDRDPNQALRAEQECKQLVLQYPNSKFAPEAEQCCARSRKPWREAEMRVRQLY